MSAPARLLAYILASWAALAALLVVLAPLSTTRYVLACLLLVVVVETSRARGLTRAEMDAQDGPR